MKNVVYMQISRDKYELPLAVGDSVRELSKILGVSENAISRTVNSSGGKGGFRKYIKVKVEDE